MILSQRLKTVSSLVTDGYRLADIGTDHGFVPIFLVEEGRIPSAVAMDVNPGPLQRAAQHILAHELGDRIRTRLSDGLEALGADEADSVLIAGMGGALTVRILKQRKDLCREIKELILQPQSEIETVRLFLEHSGWKITEEQMVLEDGKYYPMMRCIPGKMHLTEIQQRYGPCLMKDRPEPWIRFLEWRRDILGKNLAALEKAGGARGEKRRSEVLQAINEIDGLLKND